MGLGKKFNKAVKKVAKVAVKPVGAVTKTAGKVAKVAVKPVGAVTKTAGKVAKVAVKPVGAVTKTAGKAVGGVLNMLSPGGGTISNGSPAQGDSLGAYGGLAPSLSQIYATPATPMSTEGMELPTFTPQDAFAFDPSQFANSDAYKFMMDEMVNATNRAAAARGQTHSGNVLTELQNRAAGLASQGYGDEFARQMQQYGVNQNTNLLNYNIPYQRAQDVYGRGQTQMNWLANLAGYGQNANTMATGAGQNMANAIGGYQMANAANIGNAAANKYGSLNNAIQGGLQNYLTYNQMQNNRYNPGGYSAYGPYASGYAWG